MTARILQFVRIERDVNLPAFITANNLKMFIPSKLSATSSIERECPKVREIRRNCKLWLKRKPKFSGGGEHG